MDEFERWLKWTFQPVDPEAGGEECVSIVPEHDRPVAGTLTRDQSRRLALRLLSLSGHAPGPLPPGELEAIRGRVVELQTWPITNAMWETDRVATLLAAIDALAADLAAAEGVLSDMKDDRLAYQMGVEDERGRCVASLRERARRLRRQASEEEPSSVAHALRAAHADALDSAADLVESPPAPAAAPEEE